MITKLATLNYFLKKQYFHNKNLIIIQAHKKYTVYEKKSKILLHYCIAINNKN